jgi:hypothetical protein
MCLQFAFLLLTRVTAWLRLSQREEAWKTAEILILRHQLAVLQRRKPRRPHLTWADRALLAALLSVIPKAKRQSLRLLWTAQLWQPCGAQPRVRCHGPCRSDAITSLDILRAGKELYLRILCRRLLIPHYRLRVSGRAVARQAGYVNISCASASGEDADLHTRCQQER